MLAGFLFFFGLFLCLWYAYMRYVEPQILTVKRYALPLALPALRIAFVSDLHVKPTKAETFLSRVVEKVNNAKPDLVLLGGDLLDELGSPLSALAPLARLQAPLGVYSVLGNHDTGAMHGNIVERVPMHPATAKLVQHLETLNVAVLQNRHVLLSHEGHPFAVAGVGDIWSRHHELQEALAGLAEDIPAILLSHNPDIIADEQSRRAALILSGHTHGGQFRLPFYGPLSRQRSIMGRKYDQGLFPVGENTTLIISRGIGEALTQARFLAWPQVVIVDVK